MNATKADEETAKQSVDCAQHCCCTVAQAARKGHYEEINQLICSGTCYKRFLVCWNFVFQILYELCSDLLT